ncbi:hypothetical protein [Ensifer sp. LCM 4579]|uniref:hypothetical protein n=1 Tax=Ensifer sp. LCM 4579 TaxID=1848292 RepID=UPI001FCDB426|nr:hypothetical protein [Ensifer sp. LCM 4579]
MAESMSAGLEDEPQEEDAQPLDVAVVSNCPEDVVLVRLSSEIIGALIKRLHWRVRLSSEKQALCQRNKFVDSKACTLVFDFGQ